MFNFFSDILKDYAGEYSSPSFVCVNYDNKLVYIEGVKKLLEITENRICIKLKVGDVCIEGTKLKIREYIPGVVAITGKIVSVGA